MIFRKTDSHGVTFRFKSQLSNEINDREYCDRLSSRLTLWQYVQVLRVLLRSFFGGVGEFTRDEVELLGVLAPTVASMLSLPPAIEGGAGDGLST